MGALAKRVPNRQLPDWMVHLAALRDPAIADSTRTRQTENAPSEKARRMMGWAPRSNEEALVATVESLVRLGLRKDSPKKAA
jgi:hypothetical protein